MHARRYLPFTLVAVAVVVGCEPQKAAAPVAEARFAVGSVPYFAPPGAIAHGRDCITEFNRGAENGKPLAAPGRFTGVCKGNTLTFEAVPVARVVVSQSSSHDGLGSMELDHTHPEWTISLAAMPQDAAGAPLDHGEYGYAFWKPGPGCESVVRLETLVGESGNKQPADSMQVTAIAAGTCDVAIEYLGVHTSAKITVR
jgi:hypothetical protein